MPQEPTPDQRQQIADAIAAGRKIEAIKLYREATGCDLKDAKDFIEKLTAELQKADPEKFPRNPAAGKGCLVVLFLFVVLVAAVSVLLFVS